MPNTSDWDNADFLMDLGIALFTAAQANKALPVPVKEAVEAYLKERGWKTSFDAVRGNSRLNPFPSNSSTHFPAHDSQSFELHLDLEA
ncbi:Hypothetical protein NCS54_00527400 [Fusarium falciforme]|uniref:Hypothetical protein n=1 Tax=Fusarium falciforme TaxID=195108 RepID=UPI002300BB56|nr:Hypothetical protein NCS54_00527400 [Fusarium falciforme]WAO87951.1 Hypothetical protein NCS54_00527400 [Fusarium falciforme]